MKTKKLLFFLGLILFLKPAFGQWYFEIKLIGISAHLKKNPHPHLYKRKFDRNGFLVLNLGVIVSLERYIMEDIVSLKLSQAIFSDCANQLAGFSHFGARLHHSIQKHHFAIGNGPTLFYRKDWSALPGYVDEGLFKKHDGFQYRYFWYAGEVTYDYQIHPSHEYSLTIIPGPPEFTTVAPGIRIKK